MSRRKRIAIFAAFPEIVHVRRIMDGIRSQCEKYDYDLCVFASSTHLSFPHVNYMRGETNIYELANLDELDGVIIDQSTMTGDKDNRSLNRLMERLAAYPDKPRCSLEISIEDTKLIKNDNEAVLREMCRHVIEKHGRKKICILTGHKGNEVAEERLKIFLDEIDRHGMSVLPEHIVYGDFWYFSGDKLANRICDGEIERPDAVICASDCMAIGLMERLSKRGVKIPDDIMVIAIDATDEAAINPITLSSYDTGDVTMGADAVDYIRSVIDPDKEIVPLERNSSMYFHPGASCGCQMDPIYAMKRFRDSLYICSYNHADEELANHVSIGTLMESYSLESFTASGTPEECLGSIAGYLELLKPYENFYLCLKDNWLDVSEVVYEGYPEKMSTFIAGSDIGEESYYGAKDAVRFKTSCMHPKLDEERDHASVFYFSPVHFDGVFLGYAVLQRALLDQPVINVVYRNWLRYINNGLELVRSKERLQTLSVRDQMTGAFNRRGMYERYAAMLATAAAEDSLFVSVLDMDGLKYINDTFGHSEGDAGIKCLCSVLTAVARPNEIVVRSGGDEFFLIGVGKYTKDDEAARASEFADAVAKKSATLGKPYNVSASIGCMVFDNCRDIDLDNALSEADEKMYNYKMRHRRHRSV
ncbi:MAG: GGDEF domain-containing protein [Lachnospiraceae bacterium]|nr:GGDEF domain-containing protein [Lachnospiraceae bacterium]